MGSVFGDGDSFVDVLADFDALFQQLFVQGALLSQHFFEDGDLVVLVVVVRVDSDTHTLVFYGMFIFLKLELLLEADYLLLADLLNGYEFGLELVDLEGVVVGFGLLVILVILQVLTEFVGWRGFVEMGMQGAGVVDLG